MTPGRKYSPDKLIPLPPIASIAHVLICVPILTTQSMVHIPELPQVQCQITYSYPSTLAIKPANNSKGKFVKLAKCVCLPEPAVAHGYNLAHISLEH